MKLRKHPTQKQISKNFKYKNGVLYYKVNTHKFKIGDAAGRDDGHGYTCIYFQGKIFQAHRLIWILLKGKTKFFIDHKNNIKNDNRISNLRIATKANNEWNSPKRSHNTTGYKGVYKLAKDSPSRYWAYITVNGKRHGLGMYKTAEEAALSYNKASKKFHGKFAFLNEVKSV